MHGTIGYWLHPRSEREHDPMLGTADTCRSLWNWAVAWLRKAKTRWHLINTEIAEYMARSHALLKEDFWKTATVEDVITANKDGADVHVRDEEFETTPLHFPARSNDNPAVVGLLLAEGKEITARNNSGATSLHRATQQNVNPEVAELLLDRGANAATQDQDGKCPFEFARGNEHLKNRDVYWRLNELRFR